MKYKEMDQTMKTPEECANLAEIRAEIDAIDQQVIMLLGQRFAYVKAAARYKTSESGVRAPERQEAMLKQRRLWAEGAGLDPDVIERLYRELVAYFVNAEMAHWRKES
jgi:isochorismate pyruvate lyase